VARVSENAKVVGLLMECGLPRSVAKVLAFIKDKDETVSREIEKHTGLRQPEVSIAMQWLRKKGWVVKRDIKKEGKGRPVHGYRLARPFSEIVQELIEDQRQKIKDIEKRIKALEKLL